MKRTDQLIVSYDKGKDSIVNNEFELVLSKENKRLIENKIKKELTDDSSEKKEINSEDVINFLNLAPQKETNTPLTASASKVISGISGINSFSQKNKLLSSLQGLDNSKKIINPETKESLGQSSIQSSNNQVKVEHGEVTNKSKNPSIVSPSSDNKNNIDTIVEKPTVVTNSSKVSTSKAPENKSTIGSNETTQVTENKSDEISDKSNKESELINVVSTTSDEKKSFLAKDNVQSGATIVEQKNFVKDDVFFKQGKAIEPNAAEKVLNNPKTSVPASTSAPTSTSTPIQVSTQKLTPAQAPAAPSGKELISPIISKPASPLSFNRLNEFSAKTDNFLTSTYSPAQMTVTATSTTINNDVGIGDVLMPDIISLQSNIVAMSASSMQLNQNYRAYWALMDVKSYKVTFRNKEFVFELSYGSVSMDLFKDEL